MSPSRILTSNAAPAVLASQRPATAVIVPKKPAVASRAAALMTTMSTTTMTMTTTSTTSSSPLSSSRPRLSPRRTVVTVAAASPATATTTSSNNGDDVQGEMLNPSVFNKPIVRASAIAAGVAAAAAGTGAAASAQTLAAVHLTSWSIALGTMIYVTFFAGIAMFKNLPRQQFGKLQSKLFPLYFSVIASCAVFALSSLYFGPGLLTKQALTLGTTLGATLVNLAVVEPAATRSMFERYELENDAASGKRRDEARVAALKKEFGRLHGLSSALNLFALVAAVAHGAWLAQHLSLPMGGFAVLAK